MDHNIDITTTNYDITRTDIKIKQNDRGTHNFIFQVPREYLFALIKFKRPDNLCVASDNLEIVDGELIYKLEDAVISKVGEVKGEISLYTNEGRITTNTFVFQVLEEINVEKQIEKNEELLFFEKMVETGKKFMEEVENVKEIAIISANKAQQYLQEAADVLEDLNNHITNIDLHTSKEEKVSWTQKQEKLSPGYGIVMSDNIVSVDTAKTVKRYGARRVKGASSSNLERVWDAVGLIAEAGVDQNIVRNDFDNIYPWSHIRRCNIEVIDGKIVVNAYEGEPSYKTDGSNGNVAVEIPKFYICPPDLDDDYEYFGVSEYPIGGWCLAPDFIGENGEQLSKVYYSAYTASVINEGEEEKLVSRAGMFPEVCRSRTSFRNLAKKSDDCCSLIGVSFQNILSTLFAVEFATLNSQSIMSGVSNLPYYDTHRPVIEENGVNRVILENEKADGYVIGATLDIGKALGTRQVAINRIITKIEPYNIKNKAIYFSGDPVDVRSSKTVFSVGWETGKTDEIIASSGSIISKTNGKYPCKYRGIENPWGNIWQWVDGVNIKENKAWVCENPSFYEDDVFISPYKSLNYINMVRSGFLKKLGYDKFYPWARLPEAAGASSSTYFSDYYYASGGNRALMFGGGLNSVAYGGVWCCSSEAAASETSVLRGARLCWKQGGKA